jgi:hypothetical protein
MENVSLKVEKTFVSLELDWEKSASVITGGGVTDMCMWLIYRRGRIQQVKSECF